ncbi:MAG TPA: S8 family serine peptidase [Candidatus Saccharimonadia bacterium]|jgi:subtilase family serine protease|nr:S8 family serine peptidase [Candidatus Saccharimonadia bacterium]
MGSGITAVVLALLSWLPFSTPASHVINRTFSVCTAPADGDAACSAKVFGDTSGHVHPAATRPAAPPPGMNPSQLRTAYGVTVSQAGRVGIVVANDNPNAQTDLNAYSQAFGLPTLPACKSTTQASCFGKYDQRGGTLYPFRDRGWAFEASLDVQTVHALCPTCRIDLIEASSASFNNLMTAIDRAVTLGDKVVSMSWGAGEFSSETNYDSHFNVPGVSFLAATGDSGYGTLWPAASGKVVGVGGTTLTLDGTGARLAETAWSDGGSGCSRYEAKPAWQHDTGCSKRTIADVAADADPATGIAIYSTYNPYGNGWFQVGGTSLSTPLIASLVAQTPAISQAGVFSALYGAAGSASLYDVTGGSNGSCTPAYLCTAGTGYDGPTGLGAPIGLGAL